MPSFWNRCLPLTCRTQLLVTTVMPRQGHSPEKICMTSEGVSQSVFGKVVRDSGKGESLPVAFRAWHLAIVQWEALVENTNTRLQGSFTKGRVAADLEILPNKKASQSTMNFSFTVSVIIRLRHIPCLLLAAREQFQSSKEITSLLSQNRPSKMVRGSVILI